MLGGRFGYFFSCFGGREGRESSRRKRGATFGNREGGGFRGGEAGWCTPGLGGCRGEGGAKYIFSGPKCPPSLGNADFLQKTADFKTAGTRKKLQIGVCPFRLVPLNAALEELGVAPKVLQNLWGSV